jgi:hypothetical protein
MTNFGVCIYIYIYRRKEIMVKKARKIVGGPQVL